MQVEPVTSVFIGDHPMNDIEPSKQVGMISIWKKDVAWQDVKAHYIIEQLKKKYQLLLGIYRFIKNMYELFRHVHVFFIYTIAPQAIRSPELPAGSVL